MRQIRRLHDRMRIIGITQARAMIAFVLALREMVAAFFDEPNTASMIFLWSITLLIISMLQFAQEIQIANTALNIHLPDLKTHQA